MGASTRASLDAIRGQVGSVSPSADLVAGLCAAGRAIAQYPSLLHALADHGHSVTERSTLLGRALSSASGDVKTQLESLIGHTWSKPGDLLAGIEEFAVRLGAKAAGSADLTGELLQMGRVIRSHSDLQLALSDKRAKAEDKIAVVEKLFAKKVSPVALALAAHLVALPRGRRVSDALAEAASVVSDQQGKGLAEVRVASPLAATQHKAIEQMLHSRFGRDHYLDEVVDPSMIGGVRIRVADLVIDASVHKQLTDMRLQLAG